LGIYVLTKGSKMQKQALLLIVISLIPAILYQRKISTKLVYIPSIGVAILAASIMSRALSHVNQVGRKIIWGCLIIYFTFQSGAVILTINYYIVTQKTVSTLLNELDRLNIDWDRYQYMLFDNVPGRARLGNAFKYRHKKAPILFDSYAEADNPIDIANEKQRLKAAHLSYILIDFASGHPVVEDTSSGL
jgi:hypothetical protein